MVLLSGSVECISLLALDEVQACFDQVSVLSSSIANSDHPQLFAIVGDALGFEPLALMTRKSDFIFNGFVNKALMSIFEKQIYKNHYKWFRSKIIPGINLNISISIKSSLNGKVNSNMTLI